MAPPAPLPPPPPTIPCPTLPSSVVTFDPSGEPVAFTYDNPEAGLHLSVRIKESLFLNATMEGGFAVNVTATGATFWIAGKRYDVGLAPSGRRLLSPTGDAQVEKWLIEFSDWLRDYYAEP